MTDKHTKKQTIIPRLYIIEWIRGRLIQNSIRPASTFCVRCGKELLRTVCFTNLSDKYQKSHRPASDFVRMSAKIQLFWKINTNKYSTFNFFYYNCVVPKNQVWSQNLVFLIIIVWSLKTYCNKSLWTDILWMEINFV